MPIHYRALDELSADYQHIYLSPHFDDAALSCGGAIARATSAGQAVLVLNTCTGQPPIGTLFSPFATDNHRRWGLLPAQVMAQRLQEDIQALETLGADSLQFDLLDAIYRMPKAYNSNATLFGDVATDDPLFAQLHALVEPVVKRFPHAVLYAPLAVGNHVDHQVAFAVGQALAQAGATTAFYEDLPYALKPNAVTKRLEALSDGVTLSASLVDISDFMARKISAVDAYTSQIGTLFGSSAEMTKALETYAQALRPNHTAFEERLWLLYSGMVG